MLKLLLWAVAVAGCCVAQNKVGIANRSFTVDGPYEWRAAKTHALNVIVWYPASSDSVEAPQWLGPPNAPVQSAGSAAPDATLAANPGRFPLIALSHGTGGAAIQMAWLGTYLASHGFIAVAVNHPGNNFIDGYTIQGFSIWWERARDIIVVIDRMLADPTFGNRIDARRIGAAGFSLGGYTMIELAGGITEREALIRFCASPKRDAICKPLPEMPDAAAKSAELERDDPQYRAALSNSGKPYRDPRIRAVFAIAPAIGQAFPPKNLAGIHIPVDIVAGAADDICPVATNAEYFAKHIHGARVTILPGGVSHYTFLNDCTDQGRKVVHPFCDDAPGVNRAAVHVKVASMAVSFFEARFK